MDPLVSSCVEELRKRFLGHGGFQDASEGAYRPDATAWAVMALRAAGINGPIIGLSQERLVKDQQGDGRIGITPDHPEAFWPTPLAILAWQGSSLHKKAQASALDFLLGITGAHWPKEPGAASSHDTALIGWPWIEKTHSWVEPTCLAIQALKATGHEKHGRVTEAVRMLLDRQLPKGGWNCGNTMVFGRELQPLPDYTGIALDALSGLVPIQGIQKSLQYLRRRIQEIRSPMSLSWALLGLGAWGERPGEAWKWLAESWGLQERYGPYATSLISMLLIAHLSPSGLMSLVGK